MKRQMGYWDAIVWIALNDEPLERDCDLIAGFISVALCADIFGRETKAVAFDVYKYRVGARNRYTGAGSKGRGK